MNLVVKASAWKNVVTCQDNVVVVVFQTTWTTWFIVIGIADVIVSESASSDSATTFNYATTGSLVSQLAACEEAMSIGIYTVCQFDLLV